MQRYMLIFTTACCFIFAALNLFLNWRLYEATRLNARAAELADATTGAPVFSNLAAGVTNIVPYESGSAGLSEAPGDFSSGGAADADASVPADKAPLYFLGISDGYIAVYYGSSGGTAVKDVTGFPANALPFDEKLRLTRKIPVYDERQLANLLQDYGS